MSRMRMLLGGAMVLALGVGVVPLQAQVGQGPRDPGFRGDPGPHVGRSLEVALSHQEELNLTQDQVAQLQELKGVVDGDVAGLVLEMDELRGAIRSGDVQRQDGLRQMEALRGELIQASAPLRGRVQEILTVSQHQTLQGLIRPVGAGMGRGGAMRNGRGPRAPVMGNRGRIGSRRPGGLGRGMIPGRGLGGGQAAPPPGGRNGRGPFRDSVGGQGSPGVNGTNGGDFRL